MFRLVYLHLAFNILAAALHFYNLISKYDALITMGKLTDHMIIVGVFHIVSIIATITYLSYKEYNEVKEFRKL